MDSETDTDYEGVIRILFYDDTEVFGGHQRMALAAVEHLFSSSQAEVVFAYNKGNKRLEKVLQSIPANDGGWLRKVLLPFGLRRGDALFAPFSWLRGLQWCALIHRFSPDKVVVVQGGPNVCAVGLFWSWVYGVRTLSYLPMTHHPTGHLLRDEVRNLVYALHYRLPQRIITVSKCDGERLLACGARAISVVPNGVDTRRYSRLGRFASRAELSLRSDEYVMAILGRVLFEQKGHDLLVEALPAILETIGNVKLLVVGDGPDLDRLKGLAVEKGVQYLIDFLPWAEDLSVVYSAVDMVVIPSRFEGLPMVMLEAMYYGLPIVASDIDGISEVLPTGWLFPVGDVAALAETVTRLRFCDASESIEHHRMLIQSVYTMDRFREGFAEVLVRDCC